MSEKWNCGERINKRYEIHAIKKGGMGVVFLCYDHENEEAVAIKTFQDKYLLDTSSIKRFIAESYTWINLPDHKNIVKAFHVENIMHRPYLFLEYIAGHEVYGSDLASWLNIRKLPLKLILDFAIQICSGMIQALRSFKLLGSPFVHRDLKPSNIMITRDGIVKITDFGLTKALEDFSFGWGTPEYMAPEQFLTIDNIDTRTDIYSFGCVLYEMVCGRGPFIVSPENDFKTKLKLYKKMHLGKIPQEANLLNPLCPKKLSTLIHKCLEKNPERRAKSFLYLREKLLEIYESLTGERIKIDDTISPSVKEEDILLKKVVSLAALGKSKEALSYFDRAFAQAKEAEQKYKLHCIRGSLYSSNSQIDKALRDFQKAIEINPNHHFSYGLRANLYNNSGQFFKALEDYHKALIIDNTYEIGFYNRGLCFLRLKMYGEAISDFSRAIELGFIEAYTNRGGAYQSIGQYDNALSDYFTSLRHNPRDAIASANIASIYMDLGRIEDALTYYNTAVALNPFYIFTYFKRGTLYQMLEQYYNAIQDYEKALTIKPEEMHNIPGTIYALTEYELRQLYYGIYHDCGIAYLKTNQPAKAREYFRQFLINTPPEYEKNIARIKALILNINEQLNTVL
jgi:serine/threonine protein kinase